MGWGSCVSASVTISQQTHHPPYYLLYNIYTGSAGLEFLAYTVSIFSFLRLGRRVSVSVFMAGGGLALLATPALRTEAGRAALAQLGKFMITASFAMVYQ